MKKRKKGFTLIELIAVLVIMAIIALIVTPLVMSIIRKAKITADKRSVDAYGRSIELAIAGYLMDTGDFPTSIDQLTIEYSGSQVVCSTTQINTDSSVYLADCTVAGRSVENYTYGTDKSPTYTAYTVGDQVTYNNVNYYVIKDSGAKESAVTLLKAEPLSVEEVNTYSAGTGASISGRGMQYGTTSAYSNSYIKTVVEAWAADKVSNGLIEVKLISKEEIETELVEVDCCGGCGQCISSEERIKDDWGYNSNYKYWTMTPDYTDSTSSVMIVESNGKFSSCGVANGGCYSVAVRPVIVLSKSAL